MNAVDQEQALLALIATDRERRSAEIMNRARDQAAELLHQAHAQARQRVHAALTEARQRARLQISAAAAQRQTRTRLAQQQSASDFLARALKLLPTALQERWRDAAARQSWVRNALAQAALALPPGDWWLDHAPGLDGVDCAALGAYIPAGTHIEWRLNPDLAAGVRIGGNGNRIDATLNGLLADREALAASLLHAWESAS